MKKKINIDSTKAAQLTLIKTNLVRGDRIKIAKKAGVHHTSVTNVLRGDYNNYTILKIALDVAESNIKQSKEISNRIKKLQNKD